MGSTFHASLRCPSSLSFLSGKKIISLFLVLFVFNQDLEKLVFCLQKLILYASKSVLFFASCLYHKI